MTDKTIIPILPPYLDCPATHNGKGDPSAGLSVFLLKLIVALSPWFEDDGYEFNDEYCEGLMHAVERMQEDLGFEGNDIDGCFGQGTREALAEQFGFDIDSIPWDRLQMPNRAQQPDGKTILWPPVKSDDGDGSDAPPGPTF